MGVTKSHLKLSFVRCRMSDNAHSNISYRRKPLRLLKSDCNATAMELQCKSIAI